MTHGPKALGMGLDHEWSNPYSSLRPMGNVYPYSIVVEANVWSQWQKRGIYCRSDFSASGQQGDDFIWIRKKLCNTIEILKMSNF